ncbi:MAG: 23S rRNA (guanosine(2251)-2'-O)-methyltransferase RlmB [Bacilli bacterium]|jgi:23S rRNA (guanosine2251-2'-O)-methyltransferase|nr:23S rRNA (guanosine(2251)-2'-O)-methyltransferase RlmB [Bacilli bacterium]
MYIYGKNTIIAYVNGKKKLETIYISEDFNDRKLLSLLDKNNYQYIRISKSKLNTLSNNANHQGIVAKVFAFEYKDLNYLINKTLNKDSNTILILDGLEDPQNFGSIIRTSEALQIDGIIIPKNRSVKVTPTVVKVSTGAINNVDIIQVTNLNNTIKELKKNGYWVIGTEMNAQINYDKLDYDMKVALVIGSEGKGISEQVKKHCDYLIKIPMYGQTSSLNAAVSASVILYQINSIRNK